MSDICQINGNKTMIDFDFISLFIAKRHKYSYFMWNNIFTYIEPIDEIIDKYGYDFNDMTWILISSTREPDDKFLDKYKNQIYWPKILEKKRSKF